MMTITTIVVLVATVTACVTDIRSRRIPNWLTLGVALAGLVFHASAPSGAGLGTALAGLAVGVALFLPIFLLGGMGGGDVKLLGALGAWVGPVDALWIAAYTSMAGGVLAVILACRQGYLRTLLRNIGTLLRFWWLVGPRPMAPLTLERGTGPRLAYAVPFFLGTVVMLWRQ